METSKFRESAPHPDAKYRGKKVELEHIANMGPEFGGETKLKLTLEVDSRPPEEWGTHPITLLIQPVITRTNLPNLKALISLRYLVNGPLSDILSSALNAIDQELIR